MRQRRELYVKAVTELYLYGITKLGNLVIVPSEKTKNVRLKASDIAGADWVILASLRDSENKNFRYDSPSREIAGITMPGEMINWFKQVGATNVVHNYGIVFPEDINNLAIANTYFNSGYSVCLFVNIAMIADVTFTAPAPNHWVLLNSEITTDGKLLTPSIAKSLDMKKTLAGLSAGEQEVEFEYDLHFKVFTFGYKYFPVDHAKTDRKDIMNYYYGYVAAKW